MAVVGSRNFTDYELVRQWVQMNVPDMVVSGGARGADTIAADVADELDIPVTVYRPEWNRHGKSAAFIRNQQIVDAATEMAAFFGPSGPTPGTSDAIERAQAKGIPVHIFFQSAE